MTHRPLLWIFIAALSQAGLHAAEDIRPAAGFAFPSVQEAGSARAIALGSTYVGIAEGSSSLLWNPAGLGTLLRPELSLHHTAALVGAYQEIAALGLPLGYGNGLGASLNYEDNGTFDGRDLSGARTSDYSAKAYGGSLGWGFGGPGGLFAGFALKANHQDLAGSASDAFAGDLGLLWNISPLVSLGAAYTNMGPDVGGRQLAQGLRIGASSYIENGENHEWLLALSSESLTHGDSSIHLGLEHTFYKLLALRAGYTFDLSQAVPAGLLGCSFGGGVLVHGLSIDYAYVPLADLGNTQRVSLTYAFGEVRVLTPTVEALSPKNRLAPILGKSYEVKQGDSLWTISGKNRVLGDSFLWPLLYKANGDQLSNPDQIEAHQDLRFKKNYSKDEIDKATKKAQDRPVYVR